MFGFIKLYLLPGTLLGPIPTNTFCQPAKFSNLTPHETPMPNRVDSISVRRRFQTTRVSGLDVLGLGKGHMLQPPANFAAKPDFTRRHLSSVVMQSHTHTHNVMSACLLCLRPNHLDCIFNALSQLTYLKSYVFAEIHLPVNEKFRLWLFGWLEHDENVCMKMILLIVLVSHVCQLVSDCLFREGCIYIKRFIENVFYIKRFPQTSTLLKTCWYQLIDAWLCLSFSEQ